MAIDFKSLFAKYKPYLVIAGAFFAILITLIFILNQFLLPLFIHSGESVKVPNFVGMKIENANILINDINLDVERISEQYSEVIPNGVIINQVPKAGLYVKEGRNVYLTVSKGKETVKMPFLIGQTIWSARRTIQSTGLLVGEISYAASESYGKDTVMVQSINAGQDVVYGQQINLVISRGSDNQVYAPNLVGLSLYEAEALANESQLSITSIDTVDHDTFITGTVTYQTPNSGALINKTTGIKISISR